ncbi:hypothetical protein [Anaerobiospirillum sp. NML120449]|uniref:hypothetical protein n=1 Tax=Anaerobiospirillum sp. NML120449 TaxID=2932817 RepID=UPI001FF48509|nr:hypothetical protein [Anaerobiospirillum sp. NML120449]MCK0526642.1 hypothetical protein [Anaerobiospirillum sp. NML120449]
MSTAKQSRQQERQIQTASHQAMVQLRPYPAVTLCKTKYKGSLLEQREAAFSLMTIPSLSLSLSLSSSHPTPSHHSAKITNDLASVNSSAEPVPVRNVNKYRYFSILLDVKKAGKPASMIIEKSNSKNC